jgi:hypothetical protein
MSVLLELNDWQLSCFDSNANCFYQQAAAAVADDGGLVFGNAALAHSRSKPQSFNGQYLSRLNTESLPQPIGPAHNNADLVYHQLQDLRQQHSVKEVAVAAPAHYSDEQLGLLLGIASEAGIAIKGFVDSALAHGVANNGRYQLLDIGMNYAYLSDIEALDGELRVVGSSTIERLGMINIIDAWLQVIANSFMQSSRFDPLHSAASEQQAFDQAFRWISSGVPNDPSVTVTLDGTTRQADVTPTQLSEAIRQRMPTGELNNAEHLVLTPRANSISSLQSLLSDFTETISTSPGDVMTLLQLQQKQNAAEPTRITEFRGTTSAVRQPSSPAGHNDQAETKSDEQSYPPATHLLADHQAIPLTAETLQFFFDEDGLLRPGADVRVNGSAPTRAKLRCADQVQLLDQTWVAIRIAN